ncbi:hypothetical protein GQX73_g10693 [Xylaria multiplex]|uniref:Uncharacterized protein n=1 Tax=Xylaria multiplex TaxID=323545 RepID=A0A7C8IJ57_9PEZI|nr:hypothetical protein GQX73_g10693 [Xylaria multiplex]
MSRNKAPPSFFLVPDEKVDYKPFIKLGNILYRTSQPDLVLFDPEKAVPPLSIGDDATVLPPPKTLKNYNIENDNAKSSKYGLFCKILDFFGLGGNISHTSGTDISERYEIKSMTISVFVPPPSFLDSLQTQECIRDVIESCSDHCAFLITGVVEASGVVFKSTEVQDQESEASIGVNTGGSSAEPMGKRSRKRTLKINWEDEGPTVLAFKVQKIQLSDGKLTSTEETEGAYFGTDDEVENVAFEFDGALDEYDVYRMEPELVHDEFTGLDYHLYLPDE